MSGKVVTPAKAADSTKGSVVATARVWASTDPTKKIAVGADGSYTLKVAGHRGSFTITAEYTASNKNYKSSAPKTVSTTGPAIENQNIDGAMVTAEVEGIEAARDTTGADGLYSVTFNHPGRHLTRHPLFRPRKEPAPMDIISHKIPITRRPAGVSSAVLQAALTDTRSEGLEPPAHGFEVHCSIQLSYERFNVVFRKNG